MCESPGLQSDGGHPSGEKGNEAMPSCAEVNGSVRGEDDVVCTDFLDYLNQAFCGYSGS